MQAVQEIAAQAVYALNVGHLIEKIGAYAGFAAVIGLAVMAALYFSQARDVKRLRDWAGRAPERAAEMQSGGRTPEAAAVRTGQPVARTVGPAQPVSKPATAAVPAAAAAALQGNGEQAATPAPAAAAANAGAVPATASGPATAAGAAASAASAAPATAAPAATPQPATAPATAAGGTVTAPGPGPTAPRTAPAPPARGNAGTGAKVLPARPMQPRPRPVTSGGAGHTAVIPPAKRPRERRWTAPRYLAMIVAAVILLGVGGTLGVLALTGNDKPSGAGAPGNVPLPTAHGKKKSKSSKSHKPSGPAIDPSTVTVAVLNGTQVTGLATRIGQKVSAAGFTLGNVATASQQQRAESVVLYKPGSSRQARAVARKLDISQIEPADAQSATLAGAATVIVVVGADKSTTP